MTKDEVDIILLSLKVASMNAVLTMPVAIWIAWILARKNFPGKSLLEAFVSFPLVAPPVVTGYILLILLGRNGIIGSWLYNHFSISLTFNTAAIIIASFIVSLPLAVRSIRSAFELIDPSYEKTSYSLGASKTSTFFRVSLPMAMPGVISGMVLTFARSLGEFGATITIAGNISGKTQTIATMVYSYMQLPGMETQVARLVMFSVVISLLAILISEYLNRYKNYFHKA